MKVTRTYILECIALQVCTVVVLLRYYIPDLFYDNICVLTAFFDISKLAEEGLKKNRHKQDYNIIYMYMYCRYAGVGGIYIG